MTELVVSDGDLSRLIGALQMLKHLGGRMEDGRSLWCSDGLLQTQEYLNNVEKVSSAAARVILSKLKSSSKALKAISKSLDDAIQRITDRYARPFRISGFKSLPNELIARIFELHHEAEANRSGRSSSLFNYPRDAPIKSSNVLASVCKRFRQIALRIPSLWEEVSNRHGTEWIVNLKGRTQTPFVYIETSESFSASGWDEKLAKYTELLHQSDQWKGLVVRYAHEKVGNSIFKHIATALEGDLSEIETLTLDREGEGWHNNDDGGIEAGLPSAMLTDDDLEYLSGWQLDNLEDLFLRNIIPHTLSCSTLSHLDLTLKHWPGRPSSRWDLSALKRLLRNVPGIESFSLTTWGALAPLGEDAIQDDRPGPVKLVNLIAFSLKIDSTTEPGFVKAVMDIWDAPNLSNLSLDIHDNPMVKNDDFGRKATAWLEAVFKSSGSPSSGVIRTFPNVETFSLSIHDAAKVLPYETMLRAVPRVRELSFDLPGFSEPYMDGLVGTYGCLKDLRSLRLKDCALMDGSSILKYIKRLKKDGKMSSFDGLELDGCTKFVKRKDALQDLLCDKLILRF